MNERAQDAIDFFRNRLSSFPDHQLIALKNIQILPVRPIEAEPAGLVTSMLRHIVHDEMVRRGLVNAV